MRPVVFPQVEILQVLQAKSVSEVDAARSEAAAIELIETEKKMRQQSNGAAAAASPAQARAMPTIQRSAISFRLSTHP